MDTFSSKIKKKLSKQDQQLLDQSIKQDLDESIDWDVLNYTHSTATNPITITASGGPYAFSKQPINNITYNAPNSVIDLDSQSYEWFKRSVGQEKLLKLVLQDYLKQGKKLEALCIALKELKD